MARCPGVRFLVALAVLAGATRPARAQGGWPQWDIVLRDGSRVEANPLGAPDDAHFSISVGGFEGHDVTILRALVDYIAAQRIVATDSEAPRSTPPALPRPRTCDDVVVRRDGRRTVGRVTFTRVMYSFGTIRQRGTDIELADVAYIRFARKRCGHAATTPVPQSTSRASHAR